MFFIMFSIDIDPIYNIDPILIQYRMYHVLFYRWKNHFSIKYMLQYAL